jgi:hypothetical protein
MLLVLFVLIDMLIEVTIIDQYFHAVHKNGGIGLLMAHTCLPVSSKRGGKWYMQTKGSVKSSTSCLQNFLFLSVTLRCCHTITQDRLLLLGVVAHTLDHSTQKDYVFEAVLGYFQGSLSYCSRTLLQKRSKQ